MMAVKLKRSSSFTEDALEIGIDEYLYNHDKGKRKRDDPAS